MNDFPSSLRSHPHLHLINDQFWQLPDIATKHKLNSRHNNRKACLKCIAYNWLADNWFLVKYWWRPNICIGNSWEKPSPRTEWGYWRILSENYYLTQRLEFHEQGNLENPKVGSKHLDNAKTKNPKKIKAKTRAQLGRKTGEKRLKWCDDDDDLYRGTWVGSKN